MALSASKALTKGRSAGAPLPVIPELDDLTNGHFRFRFRQSEMTMISGQPNAGKSLFALWLASKFDVPTLYFSADSSAWTAGTRLVAAVTGETTESVAAGMRSGGEGYYESVLDESPIRFCFDPNPSHLTIEDELDAWVERWDSWPTLIVVDNLMDVIGAGDNEFAAYKDVLLGLKTIARQTEASILVLHHMSEAGTDPLMPAPRKAIMGKVSQTPEHVLSIAMDGDQFRLSVVKHRNGPGDPTGKEHISLLAHPDRCQFDKWVPLTQPAVHPADGEWWK